MALPHSARTVLEHSMGQLVGAPFLAYVCASDEQTIERFLETGTGLDDARSGVLVEVIETAHGILKRELNLRTPVTTPPFSSAEALAQLCSYSETDGMGLTTAWRRRAGGDVETFEGGDEVEDALLALGQDFYPALLLPHFEQPSLGRSSSSLSSSRVITEHPANDRFIAGLSGAEPLRQIFPEGAVERLTASRDLMGRSRRGGGVQAVFLPSLLIAGAEASAFAERDLTLEGYLDAVREQLRIARLLASGEEPDVTATIGLQGLDAPEGFELESPWGRLRAPSAWEKRWAPLGADLVIETTFPMAVQIRDREPEGERVLPRPGFFGPQRALEQAVDQFRLSGVLASDPTNPIGVSVSWRYIPDPFQWPGFSWGLQPAAPRASRPIAELELSELKKFGATACTGPGATA